MGASSDLGAAAAGASPPVLGWTAVTGEVTADALLLFLIIFCWTPPHFWALALYRREEYANAGIPMLPVTHGNKFTRLHILLYTVLLEPVGYLILTPVFLFASNLVLAGDLKKRRWIEAFIVATLGTSIIYLIFLFHM